MIRHLDWYIAKEVIKGALVAILVLLTLLTFFSFADELGDMGKGSYGMKQIFNYLMLTLPRNFYELLAPAALVGSLVTLGALANNRELVAMQAAGISRARIIAGVLPKESGSVTINGKEIQPSIRGAVSKGISLITSSRAEEGLFMELTVRENTFPNLKARGSKPWKLIRKSQEKIESQGVNEKFNVKPRATELAIATLSGGNQQKVILGRWLSMPRKVIILEEPTAGVDVGAKTDIYSLIQEATSQKLAVLLVSTDFEEVALMAHRALVFSEGEIVKELPRSEITVENLVTYASRANVGAH